VKTAALVWLALLLTACAAPPKPIAVKGQTQWAGRISLVVEASPIIQNTAGFTLTGSASAGQLELFNPLGAKAANIFWTSESAVLTNDQGVKNFANLATALQQLLQTHIPVEALFDWLAGVPHDANGWKADLSRYAEGRLFLTRNQPLPRAEMRIALEK